MASVQEESEVVELTDVEDVESQETDGDHMEPPDGRKRRRRGKASRRRGTEMRLALASLKTAWRIRGDHSGSQGERGDEQTHPGSEDK